MQFSLRRMLQERCSGTWWGTHVHALTPDTCGTSRRTGAAFRWCNHGATATLSEDAKTWRSLHLYLVGGFRPFALSSV